MSRSRCALVAPRREPRRVPPPPAPHESSALRAAAWQPSSHPRLFQHPCAFSCPPARRLAQGILRNVKNFSQEGNFHHAPNSSSQQLTPTTKKPLATTASR